MSRAVTLYVSALSFEDRATRAFAASVREPKGTSQDRVLLVVDYRGTATSGLQAAGRRANSRQQFEEIARNSGAYLQHASVPAHSGRHLRRAIDRYVASTRCTKIVVDISCFTRAHVVAIAGYLANCELDWRIDYSVVESYGSLDGPGASGGWKDTLFVPVGRSSTFRNQGMSVGLLLLGHESARVSVALSEFEPSFGIAAVSTRSGRPDVHRVARRKNSAAINHLLSLRGVGPRASELSRVSGLTGWELAEVDATDFPHEVGDVVGRLVAAASSITPRAPVVLFPFGPKHVVFASSFLLAKTYPYLSWCLCPISRTHAIDYSSGGTSVSQFDRALFEGLTDTALTHGRGNQVGSD